MKGAIISENELKSLLNLAEALGLEVVAAGLRGEVVNRPDASVHLNPVAHHDT